MSQNMTLSSLAFLLSPDDVVHFLRILEGHYRREQFTINYCTPINTIIPFAIAVARC